MVLSHFLSSVLYKGSAYLFKVLQQDIPVRPLTVLFQFTSAQGQLKVNYGISKITRRQEEEDVQ